MPLPTWMMFSRFLTSHWLRSIFKRRRRIAALSDCFSSSSCQSFYVSSRPTSQLAAACGLLREMVQFHFRVPLRSFRHVSRTHSTPRWHVVCSLLFSEPSTSAQQRPSTHSSDLSSCCPHSPTLPPSSHSSSRVAFPASLADRAHMSIACDQDPTKWAIISVMESISSVVCTSWCLSLSTPSRIHCR